MNKPVELGTGRNTYKIKVHKEFIVHADSEDEAFDEIYEYVVLSEMSEIEEIKQDVSNKSSN